MTRLSKPRSFFRGGCLHKDLNSRCPLMSNAYDLADDLSFCSILWQYGMKPRLVAHSVSVFFGMFTMYMLIVIK